MLYLHHVTVFISEHSDETVESLLRIRELGLLPAPGTGTRGARFLRGLLAAANASHLYLDPQMLFWGEEPLPLFCCLYPELRLTLQDNLASQPFLALTYASYSSWDFAADALSRFPGFAVRAWVLGNPQRENPVSLSLFNRRGRGREAVQENRNQEDWDTLAREVFLLSSEDIRRLKGISRQARNMRRGYRNMRLV